MDHKHPQANQFPTPPNIRASAAQIRNRWSRADFQRRTEMARRLQEQLLRIAALGVVSNHYSAVV